MQLRARSYPVNRSDITIVHPWEFRDGCQSPEDSGETEDMKVEYADHSKETILEDNFDAVDALSEEVEEGESEEEGQQTSAEAVSTRSGRKVKPPSRFTDYHMN